jgi:hypothetical protein
MWLEMLACLIWWWNKALCEILRSLRVNYEKMACYAFFVCFDLRVAVPAVKPRLTTTGQRQ